MPRPPHLLVSEKGEAHRFHREVKTAGLSARASLDISAFRSAEQDDGHSCRYRTLRSCRRSMTRRTYPARIGCPSSNCSRPGISSVCSSGAIASSAQPPRAVSTVSFRTVGSRWQNLTRKAGKPLRWHGRCSRTYAKPCALRKSAGYIPRASVIFQMGNMQVGPSGSSLAEALLVNVLRPAS